MKIGAIYNKKHYAVPLGTTVQEALKTLISNDANGLLIVDGQNNLVGVLSLQDIASAIIPYEMREHLNLVSSMYKSDFFYDQCDNLKHRKVEEIMRVEIIKVTLESNIMEIIADFLKNDLYIVPVYAANKLVGVITRTEIRKALADAMHIT